MNELSLLTEFHNGKRVSGEPRCDRDYFECPANCGQMRTTGRRTHQLGLRCRPHGQVENCEIAIFRSFPLISNHSGRLGPGFGRCSRDTGALLPFLTCLLCGDAGLPSTLRRREGRSLLAGTALSYNNDRCLLHKMASGKCQQIGIEVGRTKGGRVRVLSGGTGRPDAQGGSAQRVGT